MAEAILRWSLLSLAVLIVGPAALMLLAPLTASDGVTATSPILSIGPSGGMVLGLGREVLALIMALGFGYCTAKFTSTRWGLLTAGAAAAWVAHGCGRIDEILRIDPVRGQYWMLAVEGAVLGAVAVGGAWLIAKAGEQDHLNTPPPGHFVPEHVLREPADSPAKLGVSTVCCLICGIAGAWLVAVSTLKGQTLAAGAIGALIAGIVSAMLHKQASAPWLVAMFACLAAACPMVAALLLPSQAVPLLTLSNSGELAGPFKLMPMDWIAGALIGLPTGAKWGVGLATAEKA
jgi:hypothetical protein